MRHLAHAAPVLPRGGVSFAPEENGKIFSAHSSGKSGNFVKITFDKWRKSLYNI